MNARATVLDDPSENFSDYERELVRQVREHGWRSTHVGAGTTTPAFTYTTGFWYSFNTPEVLVFDFDGKLAHDLFGSMARQLDAGGQFALEMPITGVLANEQICLQTITPSNVLEYLRSAHWFYKESIVPCVQLVWPDREARFPWDCDFDSTLLSRQPDLTIGEWNGLAEA